MFALQDMLATKKLGKPSWYRFWTVIGPCNTCKEAERALFSTEQEAMRSDAYGHSMSSYEPVDVGDGPGNVDWNKV